MFCYLLSFLIARLFPHWRPPGWLIDYNYGKWHRWVGGVFLLVDLAVIIGLIALFARCAS